MSGDGLGRYTIEGEIGRGAMGVVFRAHDTVLDRHVALKELSAAAVLDDSLKTELVERFMREARAAARLSHPNVVQMYDVFTADDRYFIAMELLDGDSLGDLMESGPLPASVASNILVQVLDAVQAAHSAGIVHRDLKPENVFILKDGRVKVADFGIAKVLDNTSASTVTQMGTILGTPGYMAPEQVQGLPVDTRADLFAIGVIGYEMFAGRNPFLASTPTATMYRIANEPLPPIDTGGVPPHIDAVLQIATAKDPAQRFSSAAEMAEALKTGHVAAPAVGVVGAAQSQPAASAGGGNAVKIAAVIAVVFTLVVAGFLLFGRSATSTSGVSVATEDSVAGAVPLDDVALDVHWVSAEDGPSTLVVSCVLPDEVPLPALVRLPIPEDADLVWSGEISGGDADADVPQPAEVVDVDEGRVVEFTAEESRHVQYEADYSPFEAAGDTDWTATLDWLQSVPSESVIVSLLVPDDTEGIELSTGGTLPSPETVEGGMVRYTLRPEAVESGSSFELDVVYRYPEPEPEPEPAPAANPPAANEPAYGDPAFDYSASASPPYWGAFFSAGDQGAMNSKASAASAATGLNTLVLDTIDYSSLGQPGQSIYVVCAGPFATQSEASNAASLLNSAGFSGAYAKEVRY